MTVPVDVRDLLRHPGAARTVAIDEPVEGLVTELVRVPGDQPIHADLLFESVMEGILVSGPITVTLSVDCARCLKSLRSPFQVDVQELFVSGAGDLDDEYPIADDEVDLEPMIRDAVLLNVPFSPLCRPECLGLCERCGGDRNLEECRCEPEIDDRWAGLSRLSFPDGSRATGSAGPLGP
jgi:uncharacterized protein